GNNQKFVRIVSDGNGGAIMCWADEREGQNFYRIYAQRIDRDGFVRWAENGVAISPAFNAQLDPQMVSDDAGGAIIVWSDPRNADLDVFAQRIDSSGNILWKADGVIVATGFAQQTDAKLTGDGQHGAIVTWSAHVSSSQDGHIFAQRIDASGTLSWRQEIMLSNSDQFESAPCITGDGSGGAYVAWAFYNNQEYDVVAQRITAGGAQMWVANGITMSPSIGAQDAPALVADGNGKAFLTYYDWSSGSVPTLQVVVINPDGTKAASLRATSTSGGQAKPGTANIGTGQLGIAWEDGRAAGKTRVYAQIIDNTGKKLWTADGVEVSSRSGDQATPSVVSDGSGGIIVVWEDKTDGVLESNIFAQKISAAGALLWSDTGIALCTAGRMQQNPVAVSDAAGGAILTWEDYRSSFSNPEIYASRILADGSFPTEPAILTLSAASVDFGEVDVGSSSSETITLTNAGGTPMTITSVTSSDPHFSLTTDSSTISAKSSAMARVRFQPTSKDTLSAHIVLESNSIFGPDTVFVSGWGSASAAIKLDYTAMNFGSVKTGGSKSIALNISNPGNDTLVISDISTDHPDFTVAISSRVLAPGSSFLDTVRFSPTDPVAVTGELTLTSNAPTSPTVLPLSGTGLPVVTMTVDLVDISFGDVEVGSHRDTSVLITNTGNDSLHIASFTSGDARFTLETQVAVIAPSESMTFTIRFTPDVAGAHSAVFEVTSNGETSPDTIRVQGTGMEVTAVSAPQVSPGTFMLHRTHPNPFSSATTIRYDLNASTSVRLAVYNALGQRTATLVEEMQQPGLHTVQWTPSGSPPGVYFLVMRAGTQQASIRMVLMP
ncbi:MAG: choice-of-anchor D domain-containing protein, partial [Bacteroidota bacterium]|nr:choice-of-anchor D domain-containing protein [Bacteroidota bacterium]